MAHSLGGVLPWSETFSVGVDTRTSVDEKDYQVPFAFTGKLNKLAVKVGPIQMSAEEKAATEKKMRDR
jgi:arylsulfatase